MSDVSRLKRLLVLVRSAAADAPARPDEAALRRAGFWHDPVARTKARTRATPTTPPAGTGEET